MVEGYNPVSSASTALLTLHNYPLITGSCSLITHLSSTPGEHTAWQPQVLAHITNHTHKPSQSYQVSHFHS